MIDEAADWRTNGQLFRNASAGQPRVIVAPNIVVHSLETLIEWIRQVSDECGGGGSYFVYGRRDATPLAMSLVLRECAATAALALVSPTGRLAAALSEPKTDGQHIAVRAMFGAQDPALHNRLNQWSGTARAARRAGFSRVDMAVLDGSADSAFVDETLRFFDEAQKTARRPRNEPEISTQQTRRR